MKRVNAWRVDSGAGGYLYFRRKNKAKAFANAGGKKAERCMVVGDQSMVHV